MSEKSKVVELLDSIKPGWAPPKPLGEGELLAQGLLLVLSRTLTESQAHQTVKALRSAYSDWNELRISQVQEFREHIKSKSDAVALTASTDVRTYLQEVFQKNHGFDLEFLREDPTAAGKFVSELLFLGGAAGHLLLSLAADGGLPVTQGVIRVLDRAAVITRTTSIKKAKERISPYVPEARIRDFAVRPGRDRRELLRREEATVLAMPPRYRVQVRPNESTRIGKPSRSASRSPARKRRSASRRSRPRRRHASPAKRSAGARRSRPTRRSSLESVARSFGSRTRSEKGSRPRRRRRKRNSSASAMRPSARRPPRSSSAIRSARRRLRRRRAPRSRQRRVAPRNPPRRPPRSRPRRSPRRRRSRRPRRSQRRRRSR